MTEDHEQDVLRIDPVVGPMIGWLKTTTLRKINDKLINDNS